MFKAPITAPTAIRCAADLRWLLQSPPLLSLAPQRFSAVVQVFDAPQSQAIAAWLNGIDTQHLQAYIAQALPVKAPMRLGRYAERLMEYALRHGPIFELIAANVPLRRLPSDADTVDDKQHTTVGEFDYLLRDAAGTHWHWEMAVKFYLCHATGTVQSPVQSHDFKGPAGKDTLGLKLSKVFDRQLQHLPPAPYDDTAWQPAAYARGWMFYPYSEAPTVCDALNPQHLRGWWLNLPAFETAVFESTHFVHLPRLHWLAPYDLDELPVLSQAEMMAHLTAFWLEADAKQADAGQLLASVEQRGNTWRELSRGFVMPA